MDKRNSVEEEITEKVLIDDFAKENGLEILYRSDNEYITFSTVTINRPGLLLAGFSDYFENTRIQTIGNAETYYLKSLSVENRIEALDKLFSQKVPCVIVARGVEPFSEMLNAARMNNVPLLVSPKRTFELVNDLTEYLNKLLAPVCNTHGVLIDVNGIGVLINGKSGIGKSETALELVHRGHRLVADDVVIMKKIKDEIIGTAPESIRFFMEIRGVGIIDVRRMFGIGSILFNKKIDIAVELVKWEQDKEYERLGKDIKYTEIMGIKIPKITIPVIPGRNLAIVIEVAARNFYLRKLGYNSAAVLDEKVKKEWASGFES